MDVTLGKGREEKLDTLVLSKGLLEAREYLFNHVGVHDAIKTGLVEFVNEILVDSSDVLVLMNSP